jgi:hypothetical protein
MSNPDGLLRSNLCVAIEIAARLAWGGFICPIRGIQSIHGHAAEMDEFFDAGVARSFQDALSAFDIGLKEFLSVSGLSHQGSAMKYKIAPLDRFTQ